MTSPPCLDKLLARLDENLGGLPVLLLESPPERDVVLAAVAELAAERRGGLLIVHGEDVEPEEDAGVMEEALAEAFVSSQISPVEAVEAAEFERGAAVIIQVRPCTVRVRPELRPVTGARLDHLDAGAVEELAWTMAEEELPGAEADRPRDQRVLLALGAAVLDEDRLVPTVAGVVALGRSPELLLAGACVQLGRGAGATREGGELGGLVDRLRANDELCREVGGDVIAELVINAIGHRTWVSKAAAVPIRIYRKDRTLVVSNPGKLGMPQGSRRPVPNPALFELLRRRGLVPGKSTGGARVERLLRERDLAAPRWLKPRGWVQVVIELPRAIGRRTPAPPPAGSSAPPPRPRPSPTRAPRPRELARVERPAEGRIETGTPRAIPRGRELPERVHPQLPRTAPPPTTRGPARVLAPARLPALATPVPSRVIPAEQTSGRRPRPRPVAIRAREPAQASPRQVPEPRMLLPALPPRQHHRSQRDRELELIAVLVKAGREMTTRELLAAVGWPRSTLRKVIEVAIAAGAIERTAASPKSPSQAYRPASRR